MCEPNLHDVPCEDNGDIDDDWEEWVEGQLFPRLEEIAVRERANVDHQSSSPQSEYKEEDKKGYVVLLYKEDEKNPISFVRRQFDASKAPDIKNPVEATLTNKKELNLPLSGRSCKHIEFDISDTPSMK